MNNFVFIFSLPKAESKNRLHLLSVMVCPDLLLNKYSTSCWEQASIDASPISTCVSSNINNIKACTPLVY